MFLVRLEAQGGLSGEQKLVLSPSHVQLRSLGKAHVENYYQTVCFKVTTTNTSPLSYQLMLEYSKGVTQFTAEAIFLRERNWLGTLTLRVTARSWILHIKHLFMFSLTSFNCAQCKLCTEWIQYGLWQASFGVMSSITFKGLNALAQALCQYAELTMALFKKKALCLFENKILAHGQRSVYTHWTSLSSCYGIPFTRPFKAELWRGSLTPPLSIPRNKEWL